MFELEPNLWDAEHPEWFIYDPESLSKVYDEIMQSINNNEIAVLKEKGVGVLGTSNFSLRRSLE